jgi:hypothetical protein
MSESRSLKSATLPAEGVLVLLVVALALFVLSVPLTGGRLGALAELHFKGVRWLLGALAVQVVILELVPEENKGLLGAVHVSSYVAAGIFILANRHIAGMLLVGLGGALNAIAITANGGVMPARAGALETAGLPLHDDGFMNSGLVHDAHLPWLGDVFGVPSSWPLANVYSVGDVVLVLGALVVLHKACRPRREPATESTADPAPAVPGRSGAAATS